MRTKHSVRTLPAVHEPPFLPPWNRVTYFNLLCVTGASDDPFNYWRVKKPQECPSRPTSLCRILKKQSAGRWSTSLQVYSDYPSPPFLSITKASLPLHSALLSASLSSLHPAFPPRLPHPSPSSHHLDNSRCLITPNVSPLPSH